MKIVPHSENNMISFVSTCLNLRICQEQLYLPIVHNFYLPWHEDGIFFSFCLTSDVVLCEAIILLSFLLSRKRRIFRKIWIVKFKHLALIPYQLVQIHEVHFRVLISEISSHCQYDMFCTVMTSLRNCISQKIIDLAQKHIV